MSKLSESQIDLLVRLADGEQPGSHETITVDALVRRGLVRIQSTKSTAIVKITRSGRNVLQAQES